MKEKNTVPYRLSQETLEFLKRINENAYIKKEIPYVQISLDDLLKSIYKYFQINNKSYQELLLIVGKDWRNKNGVK